MALSLDPARCAVITMECQRGVVGDLATFPALRQAVDDTDLLAQIARILTAARLAGTPVIHALATFRADRSGSPTNAPLLRYAATIPGQLLDGSPAAEVATELGVASSDLITSRRHGVSPFSGTDLDAILRSAEVRTVIATGVSLNVGVLGLVIEAVNLGYEVVLATDATTAVPPSYGQVIIANTFAQLATLATTDEIITALSAANSLAE